MTCRKATAGRMRTPSGMVDRGRAYLRSVALSAASGSSGVSVISVVRRWNGRAQLLCMPNVSTCSSCDERVDGAAFGGWAQNFPATSRSASFSSSASASRRLS